MSIPALAATDKAQPADGRSSVVSVFPGEYPSDKELCDWLDANLPLIRQHYGAAIRGETPAHLVQYEHGPTDLTGFDEITAGTPAAAGMSTGQIQQHNRRRLGEKAKIDQAKASLEQGVRDHKDQLAQVLVASLRPKATLRLEAMLTAHKVAGHDAHDGVAMLKELTDMRGTTGQLDETRDHDREVEEMRDNPLPDGCPVSDYLSLIHI